MSTCQNRHLQQNIHLLVIFAAATGLFLFHSYTIVQRFANFETLILLKTVYNDSLPMPIVSLTLRSWRHVNSSRPHPQIRFDVLINRQPIDPLALVREHFQMQLLSWMKELWEDSVYVNVVNESNYEYAKARSIWPLSVRYATGDRNMGFTIMAFVNASNFIEVQENGDYDWIRLRIISIDDDPNPLAHTKGIPQFFDVLPCNDMSIAVTLQRYNLIDRLDSPCRNDYPEELKNLLMKPMKPENLYNAMLTPNLPYNKRVCEELCVINYWLPIRNCVMSSEILEYVKAHNNGNLSSCDDDILLRYRTTPIDIFVGCKCYKRCKGDEFIVSASDKIHHDAGIRCSEQEKRVCFSSNIVLL